MLYHGSMVHSILDVDKDLTVVETPAGSKRLYQGAIHPLIQQPLGTFHSYTITDPLALAGERDLVRMALFIPTPMTREDRSKILARIAVEQHDEAKRLLEKTCQLVLSIQKEGSKQQVPVFSEDPLDDVRQALHYFTLRGHGGSSEVIRSEGELRTGQRNTDVVPAQFSVRFEPLSQTHTMVHVKADALTNEDVRYHHYALVPTAVMIAAFHDIARNMGEDI